LSNGDEVITPENPGFSVHLTNFDGPFDLLLQLISRHKMDITEVALSAVTDEFISFIRSLELSGEGWRLDQATEFLVIAATLLDLKAAKLLPSGEIEDEKPPKSNTTKYIIAGVIVVGLIGGFIYLKKTGKI